MAAYPNFPSDVWSAPMARGGVGSGLAYGLWITEGEGVGKGRMREPVFFSS